jgi:RNA polymerase primary sigma factor
MTRASRSGHVNLLGLDHAVFTAAQERAAFAELQAARASGCKARIVRAHDHIVTHNLRLILSIAQKFTLRGALTIEDLVQDGTIGLYRAMSKFDPDRGVKFSTYANWWIRQAMQRAIANDGAMIRLPCHLLTERTKIGRAVARHERLTGQAPDVGTLARLAGIPRHRVRAAVSAPDEPVSIDAPLRPGDSTTRLDLTACVAPSPEELVLAAERGRYARRMLETLHGPERDVLAARTSDAEPTLEAVGQRVTGKSGQPVTRERIRQLESRALGKLRERDRRAGSPMR